MNVLKKKMNLNSLTTGFRNRAQHWLDLAARSMNFVRFELLECTRSDYHWWSLAALGFGLKFSRKANSVLIRRELVALFGANLPFVSFTDFHPEQSENISRSIALNGPAWHLNPRKEAELSILSGRLWGKANATSYRVNTSIVSCV